MTVLDNTPRDQYTATGGQVAFSYTFEIAAEGDIAVLQNGVLLSLGTGAGEYAVTGVGSDTGGVVTLVTGATSGDIITLYRDMALERLTSYTNGGDFLAADVNNDYDRLWLALQQNTGTSNRALVAPNTDPTNINMTIPTKTDRLGKLLQFNATTGNPEVVSANSIVGSGAFNVYNFAGDGATVAFTLGAAPGVENNTQVYIDGVYQQKNTYTVSGTTLTFSAAPPNLSTIEVMVVTAQPVNTVNAASVSFTQAGSTDTRTVQAKLQESVSVKDFGAVGDGVTDDTVAITNAISNIASGGVLEFPFGAYKITSSISQDISGSIILEGDNSTISYENASHTEYAIRLNDTSGVDIVINNLTIDGTKKANKILEVRNNTSNTTPTNFIANELRVDNCKRLNTFSGGEGILLIGAFEDVTFNGGFVRDCELPTGQGSPGNIGIGGITITWYSTTSYVKRVTLNGLLIEKVFSSDLSYQSDQDGLKYFVPDITGGTSGKVISNLVVEGGSRFVNCYGRSIKTQIRNTVVRDSNFERSEGLTSGEGNGEIDVQSGSGVIDACTFDYSNGFEPKTVAGIGGASGRNNGASVTNCEVTLDSSTTLTNFFQPFPNAVVLPWSRIEVQGNRIFGEVERFVNFLTNAVKTHITVSDNWVEEIGVGPTTERALVYVGASGPAPHYGYVNIVNNVYTGANTAYLARHQLPGIGMNASYSGYGNFGFVNEFNAEPNDADPLKSIALPAQITGFEDIRGKGYFGMQTKFIANNATETFDYAANNTSLIIFQAATSNQSYAMISASSSAVEINSGSAVSVGATTNPAVGGQFNIWRSGAGQISVQNLVGADWFCSAWVFAPTA